MTRLLSVGFFMLAMLLRVAAETVAVPTTVARILSPPAGPVSALITNTGLYPVYVSASSSMVADATSDPRKKYLLAVGGSVVWKTTGSPLYAIAVGTASSVSVTSTVIDLPLPADDVIPFPPGGVTTQAELVTDLADAAKPVTVLSADITLTSNLQIPSGKHVITNGKKFIQGGSYTIDWSGTLEAGRTQVFSGFVGGQITGKFGTPVMPEWWGLTDNNHNVAINAAVQCCNVGDYGNTISLAPRIYITSAPIDLTGRSSLLEGAGSGRTEIRASQTWGASTFITSSLWNGGVNLANSHTALVYIGGASPAGNTMRTGVVGVGVNAYYASRDYPTKRVSCISGPYGMEEQTILHDVSATGFSGCGIGAVTVDVAIPTITNGLDIKNFWITNSFKRDSLPIYIPPITSVASIRDGTIDVSVPKSASASYALDDGNPIYSAPEVTIDFPLFGILAGGQHTTIENVHIEGVRIGVCIIEGNSNGSSSVRNIDVNHLMDRGMVYYDDPAATAGPAPAPSVTADWFADACVLMISRFATEINYKDTVTASNLYVQNDCKILLRDAAYGQNISAFGQGEEPNSESGARLTAYERCTPRGVAFGSWITGVTFTADDGTDVLTTSAVHGLVVDQAFIATGAALPAPLVSGTTYYVKTVPTTSTLTLSATFQGATLDITTAGTPPHAWVGRMVPGLYYDPLSPAVDKTYFRLLK